jgi:hypothetical protein
MLAMMRFAASFPSSAVDETTERRWRAAVLWTVHDLRLSRVRRRPLSLPNLCRLFENRWRSAKPNPEIAQPASEVGQAFLRNFYVQRAPSHQHPPKNNGHRV